MSEIIRGENFELEYIRKDILHQNNTLLYEENEKLKKEIERLNKCYCERTDCSGRIKNSKKYESMQEEIERLDNELQVQIEDNARLNEYIDKKDKEVESLKNIIEEIRHNLSRITLECCDKKTQEKLVNLFGILDKVDKDE